MSKPINQDKVQALKVTKRDLLDRLLTTVVPPDSDLNTFRWNLIERIEKVDQQIGELERG